MVTRQPRCRRGSARLVTVAAVAATGWLAMTALAAPSFASSGNGVGLANAPGQLKQQSTSPATTTTATQPTTTVTAAPVTTAATVGDPTQPQPLSNADLNPGGANNGGDCGAYCSTRNGDASLNGSNTGAAVGKPCAGCVGKADNKNPPGQQPDGSDANNGYECDGNNGIGKTNPAHTGCTSATPPTSDCTVTNTCGGTDCTVTKTCGGTDCTVTNTCAGTAGDCTATGTCPATPPSCVPTAANTFCSTVLGVHLHQRRTTPTPPTVVLGEKLTRTPPTVSVLPFTGAPLSGLLGLSTSLLLLGGLAVRLGRRRPATVAAHVRL